MARTTSIQGKAIRSTKRLALGFIDSASTILSLCAKQTNQVARNLCPEPRVEPKSQMAKPRHFLSVIRSKAARLRSKKGGKNDGEEGLWQKTILMGEKCDPLDFSGAIYYDSNGKLLKELPMRSPRANPLPDYLCDSVARREKRF